MQIEEKRILTRWQYKHRGNRRLTDAIDKLIRDLEALEPDTYENLLKDRKDMDQVHSDGFFFFNVENDRVLLMIQLQEQYVTIIWIGTHPDYERIFKNNKATIEKWLRSENHIQ